MIRSLAVARIQRGLGFRSDLTDEIVSALQEAQRLLELGRSLPDFLKIEDEDFALTAGGDEIALPSRFLREVDREGFHYTSSEDKRVWLEKVDIQTGDVRFFEEDPGRPIVYALRATTVKFWPERDTAYTLTWSYYKGAALLTSDIENEWLATAPEALIGKAGMIISEDLRDPQALEKFAKMYAEGWSGGFADSILRNQANKPVRSGAKL